jgi:hypothetical protein
VLEALLGFCSEARWLRYADRHLRHLLFPYLPKQPGYNKRLRAAADLIQHLIRVLASDTTWWTDDVWVADSTPALLPSEVSVEGWLVPVRAPCLLVPPRVCAS